MHRSHVFTACFLAFACQQEGAPPAASPAAPVAIASEPEPVPPASEQPSLPSEPTSSAALPPPKPVEPGIGYTGAPTRGTLPKAVIDERLAAARPGIAACYERALASKPKLHGSFSIQLVVGPEGKVVHADAVEPVTNAQPAMADDVLDDAATVDCILAEISKLEFPPPRGGRVFIDYPLVLEPAKPAAP